MFAKLVVLILVFGASGIGVLSVRQSRLQSVHEMAESRHSIRRLDEQAGEIRTMIAKSCTPQRVHAMIDDRGSFKPASTTPAKIELAQRVLESTIEAPTAERIEIPHDLPDEQVSGQHDVTRQDESDGTVVFTLEDGTRVVFVRE
ncbi:MAG: hypothetical protein KDA29_02050 [Phycisphaerales bacterium]|nr:hypothetical protein [Phycisphaerales bacterium]